MPKVSTVPLVLLLVALVAGCAADRSTSTGRQAASGDGYPVTVQAANGNVTVDTRPTRIVSLSPSLTEMLYAIGAGGQVVAVDEYSTYPKQAPQTTMSGFKPNIEAIAGYRPDLVVLSYNANNVVTSLRELKIPVYRARPAADLDDTYQQIAELGRLTGHPDAAKTVVQDMQTEIAALASKAPRTGEPLTFFHELSPRLYTMDSTTFIGRVYELAGLRNIANGAPKAADGSPRLSAEYIFARNPDLIFLADAQCCGVTPRSVADRPGWSTLAAVKHDNVVVLDADIASRWGPRVVDFLRTVVRAANAAARR